MVNKTPGLPPIIISPHDDKATADAKVRSARARLDERPAVDLRHSLGVDASEKLGPAQIGRSTILDVLGPQSFVPCKAVRVPGKVAWLNVELARELGFAVPPGGQRTPELDRQILDAVSYRTLQPGETPPEGAEVIEMYADRYRGTNMGVKEGSARAAFFPWGNLQSKGVGLTPLFKSGGDFQHSHGGAPMKEGVLEAIWGEVNGNLFSAGSTRILAVIDNDDHTVWPDGSKERRALIIRAGNQLRPAHLLTGMSEAGPGSIDAFMRAVAQTGDLVVREDSSGQRTPDLAATFDRLIDRHAQVAAEQFRWRIMHGALSTSNMQVDGAQLDLATETPQPRTAPIKVLDFMVPFGQEHAARAAQLQRVFSALVNATPSSKRKALRLELRGDVGKQLAARYAHHMERQWLDATGLDPQVAEKLQAAAPKLVARYATILAELAKLSNDGAELSADKAVPAEASVCDVFSCLQHLPRHYFEKAAKDDLTGPIRELLAPQLSGADRKRRESNRAEFMRLSAELGPVYAELMTAATGLGWARYDDLETMKRSITERARFENETMEPLYRARLNDMVVGAVTAYADGGDARVLTEAIDKTVAANLRSAESVMALGRVEKLADGGLRTQIRRIDGLDYAVRGWEGGRRRLEVSVPVTGDDASGYTFSYVAGSPHLSRAQVDALEYVFTTRGWKNDDGSDDVHRTGFRIEDGPEGKRLVALMPVLRGEMGRLEGVFHCTVDGDFWLKEHGTNFRGYTFGVPTDAELKDLAPKA
jgi:hypothetical protein